MDSPEWQRWVAQAQEDFAYGVAGLDEFPRGAAWNFHQAAEKSIKALLLREGVSFPRTHDLVRLLSLFPREIEVDEELREASFVLASYFPMTRYPGDFPEINAPRARDAMRASRIIINEMAKHCL